MEKKFDVNVVSVSRSSFGTVCKKAEVDSKLEALNTEVLLNTALSNPEILERVRKRFFENPNHLPTGIDFIDEVTNGGLYSAITILAGVPNVGKTTLLVQMASEYSLQGFPVVFITKDMDSDEIFIKALSYVGSNIEAADALGLNDITDLFAKGKNVSDKEKTALSNVCANLHIVNSDSGDWECIIDSSTTETSNIGRIIELYSSIYKVPPIFIIDNLQEISTFYEKSSKESVDAAMDELKRLNRRFKARMIVVSNLNRSGYHKGIEYTSLKESGNIEFGSSCILGMEIAGSAVNQNDFRNGIVRRVKIKNLKDRAGGYKEVVVEFDALRSTFSSIKKHTPAPAKSGKGRSSDRAASGVIKSVKDDGGFMDKFDKPLDDLALEALEMLKKA